MRSKAFWLVVCFLAVGCTGRQAPTVGPAEPPPQEIAPALEAVQEEALEAVQEEQTSRDDERGSDDDSGNLEAQCHAGGAQACRTLCEAEAAICEKDSSEYDKETCKEVSKDVQVCQTGPEGMRLGRLCRLAPSALSPAQGAVGKLAATCKARSLEEKEADKKWKLRRYLMARPVPVVLGPGESRFLTDRHHLSTALFISNVDDKELYICPMANRVDDEPAVFWRYMVNNNFTWLRDNRGRAIPPDELPHGFDEIGDDPFRTLSRWVRDSCGYIKCGKDCGGDGAATSKLTRCENCAVAPYFLEFRWADYMRDNREECGITDDIYQMSTAQQANELPEKLTCLMELARQEAALDLGLPGWNNGLIEPKEVVLDENGCEE